MGGDGVHLAVELLLVGGDAVHVAVVCTIASAMVLNDAFQLPAIRPCAATVFRLLQIVF